MKTTIIISIALATLVIFGATTVANSSDTKFVPWTPCKIQNEYNKNEIRAATTMTNHMLIVEGTIENITKGFTGDYLIMFPGCYNNFLGVTASVGQQYKDYVMKLNVGGTARLKCTVMGTFLGGVQMDNCVPTTFSDINEFLKDQNKGSANNTQPSSVDNVGTVRQSESLKDKEENQTQRAAVEPRTSQPQPTPTREPSPTPPPSPQHAETRKGTRTLELVYSGPMADFFIKGGDIEKNMELFKSKGSFSVELHSAYKGPARTAMIDSIKKMLGSGEMAASQESGNPDLLGHMVTAASFDTQKKTVTFSGEQSYLDTNNTTIGTRKIQETYQFDSPKYFTLGKVASSIESKLQAAGNGKGQRLIPSSRVQQPNPPPQAQGPAPSRRDQYRPEEDYYPPGSGAAPQQQPKDYRGKTMFDILFGGSRNK